MKLTSRPATSFTITLLLIIAQGQGFFSSNTPPTPSDLYLGLYTKGQTQTFTVFERDNYQHSCTEFPTAPNVEGLSEECKYYGDCCRDPMRIRERLEPRTFSCQTLPSFGLSTFYVVNKCPVQTKDAELSALCQDATSSSFPLTSTWLVTSAHSGITYKNIFCAICHGALDSTAVNEGLTNETRVEFWWSYIKCISDEVVEDLVKSRDVLERKEWFRIFNASLDIGNCSYSFTPSIGVVPHRCLPAVRSCPVDYTNEEIIELCEGAPVDYRNASDGVLYRNRFCIICNGLISNPEGGAEAMPFPQPLPPLPPPNTDPSIPFEILTEATTTDSAVTDDVLSESKPLLMLRPRLQVEDKPELSVNDRKFNQTSETTSLILSITNNLAQSYVYHQENNISVPGTFWDLGSLRCDSSYDGVCDALIKLPEMGCAGPGCGKGKWQNLDGNCSKLTDYVYEPSVRESTTFVWPESLYGRYYSTCNGEVSIEYERNCRCDTRCHYFGECCFDAPDLEVDLVPGEKLEYTCMQHDATSRKTGYAVVSSCPSGADPYTVDLCKSGVSGDWSPLGWPVYDPVTTLSFKNSYCASCNNVNVALTKYWIVLMDCEWIPGDTPEPGPWRDYCTFRTYKHPVERDPYWCYFPKPIVSFCPAEFSSWKISKDCQESVTSWVYHDNTIYRNAFCAICNIGDGIMSASVETLIGAGKLRYSFSDFLQYHIRNPKEHYTPIVEIDVNIDLCCVFDICHSTSYNLWGEIEADEQCKALPFNSSCTDSVSWSQIFQRNVSSQYLCSTFPPPQRTQTIALPYRPLYLPTSIPNPPSYIEFFFSDVGDIPKQIVLNSTWKDVLGSAQVCSNSSLITADHQIYNQFKLTPSGIQAKDMVVQTNYVVSLQIYDYILISLSLLFIFCYIIWMIATWKKTTPTKLMMIILLINQFVSLVFFSISAVFAGDNVACKVIAALNQYFFLTTLTWTNSLAIDITYTVYTIASSRSKKRFAAYSIYAFGLPLVIVSVTFGLYLNQDSLQLNSTVYRIDYLCFLVGNAIIYGLFLIPFYVLVLANIALCIASMVRVTRRVDITSTDRDRTKKNAVTCIKLSISLGLGWILVFLDLFSVAIWPLVFIFVELQGVLLVLANILGWDCIKKIRSITTTTTSTSKMTGSAIPNSTELTALTLSKLSTPCDTPRGSPAVTPRGTPIALRRAR